MDFSWRVQAAGWTLGYRGAAWVEHGLPESLRTLLRQAVRYGAGHAWLNRRHPGSFPPPRGPGGIVRGALGALVWSLTGRLGRATFKAADAAVIAARDVGYLFSNGRPPYPRPADREGLLQLAVLVDSFPEISETFVTTEAHALVREGLRPTVVAGRRADRPNYPAARGLPVHYLDDDGLARKVADLAWLFRRHPGRCVADVTNRAAGAAMSPSGRCDRLPRPLGASPPLARGTSTPTSRCPQPSTRYGLGGSWASPTA